MPADLVERLRGSFVVVECPAMGAEPEARISLKLGEKVKGSLFTRDKTVATARRLRVLEHLERLYATDPSPMKWSALRYGFRASDPARTLNSNHSVRAGHFDLVCKCKPVREL
ncbi:hypothetical protein [Methylobacterium symbioticum]|uniref:hypothetical protein n=1 Tax=Methylobacterium symbioticum TaxID=2584084 RepID=UPI001157510D|nr:hypothetical protein [Methylobacterium symbioticum]